MRRDRRWSCNSTVTKWEMWLKYGRTIPIKIYLWGWLVIKNQIHNFVQRGMEKPALNALISCLLRNQSTVCIHRETDQEPNEMSQWPYENCIMEPSCLFEGTEMPWDHQVERRRWVQKNLQFLIWMTCKSETRIWHKNEYLMTVGQTGCWGFLISYPSVRPWWSLAVIRRGEGYNLDEAPTRCRANT